MSVSRPSLCICVVCVCTSSGSSLLSYQYHLSTTIENGIVHCVVQTGEIFSRDMQIKNNDRL